MKQGWTYKKLGEVCDSINGLWKGKKPPYIKVGVIRNANFTKEFTIRYDNIEYLDVEERQYSKRKLQKGDLIIEKSGGGEKTPVGRAVLFNKEDGDFSFSNFTSVLRIKDRRELLSEFLYIYLLFIYKRGDTLGMQKATTGIHNLEFDKYLSIDIPYLPLSEQQRIVERLDSAFAHIDELKANAEKQVNEARALFQKALSKAMEPKDGWEEKTLGEITESMADGPFGSNLKKEHYTTEKEVRIIQLSNIGEDGWREDNTKYTTFTHLQTIQRSEVMPGDIVIAKMMPAGRAILCPDNEKKYVLSSDAVRATLKAELDRHFVLFSINSSYFRKQVYANVSGSGRVRTSLTKLRECKLFLPLLSEQQRIVERLDALSKNVKALEENQRKVMAECDALKQALLRKVFE